MHGGGEEASSAPGDGWERLFWSVFEQSRNAMSLLDGERRHAFVNEAMVGLLGYSREELIGAELDLLFAAEDRATLAKRWDHFVQQRESVVVAPTLVCADGAALAAEVAAHPETVTGRLLTLVVILHAEAAAPDAGTTEAGRAPLTPREREIAHLLALGLSGPEVAEQLVVSHETVRTHVSNAMAKLEARTRAQLVAIALGRGLITEP